MSYYRFWINIIIQQLTHIIMTYLKLIYINIRVLSVIVKYHSMDNSMIKNKRIMILIMIITEKIQLFGVIHTQFRN